MSLFIYLSLFHGSGYFRNHNTAAFQLSFRFNTPFYLIGLLLKLLYSLGSLNMLTALTHGGVLYSRRGKINLFFSSFLSSGLLMFSFHCTSVVLL